VRGGMPAAVPLNIGCLGFFNVVIYG
jgi:hypothetical protein